MSHDEPVRYNLLPIRSEVLFLKELLLSFIFFYLFWLTIKANFFINKKRERRNN